MEVFCKNCKNLIFSYEFIEKDDKYKCNFDCHHPSNILIDKNFKKHYLRDTSFVKTKEKVSEINKDNYCPNFKPVNFLTDIKRYLLLNFRFLYYLRDAIYTIMYLFSVLFIALIIPIVIIYGIIHIKDIYLFFKNMGSFWFGFILYNCIIFSGLFLMREKKIKRFKKICEYTNWRAYNLLNYEEPKVTFTDFYEQDKISIESDLSTIVESVDIVDNFVDNSNKEAF